MTTIGIIVAIAIVLVVILIALFLQLCTSVGSLAVWIVKSFAKMRIAKKMKVKRGWFAFIPVLSDYLEGKLAEASVAQRYPGVKPFRWGIFLAICAAISLLAGALIGIPATIISLLTNFYDLMLQTGAMFEFLPAEAVQLISLVVGLFGGAGAIVVNALAGLLNIFAVVVSICALAARYKLLAAMTGDHKVWIFILELFVSPARFVIDILLGFTNVFKKYQLDDVSTESAEEQPAAVAE